MPAVHDPALLGAALVSAINAANLTELVALYETDAVLELPDGRTARGSDEIRTFYRALLRKRPQFAPGLPLPALIVGDLALTNTQLPTTTTAEVARRQVDRSWKWILDRPDVRIRYGASDRQSADD